MNYQKIWNKILGKGEEVKHSFSIGRGYVVFNLIMWGIICLPFMFMRGFGLFMFLIPLFYFAFYIKVANVYAFTNKRVLIHRGWLSTRFVSVDYSKITDIHVHEPFVDKILTRTGNIAINTAGSGNIEIRLKHISYPYEIKKILDELKD